MSGIEQAYNVDMNFSRNQPTVQIQQSKHWIKGTVGFGLNQDSGAKGTSYTTYYRKGSGSFSALSTITFNRNDYYHKSAASHRTDGFSKYGYKIVKNKNLATASNLNLDLFVR